MVGLWHDGILYQDRCPRPEGWYLRLEDPDRVFVGPVVEDHAEEIDISLFWLGIKQPMCHECNAPFQLLGYIVIRSIHHHSHVLNEDAETRELFRDGERYVTFRATDIDHFCITEGSPIVRLGNLPGGVPWEMIEGFH